ncbi:unnamed protein product, partial [marine sediment metagenome]
PKIEAGSSLENLEVVTDTSYDTSKSWSEYSPV